MTEQELDKIIEIILTHDEGQGEYCDTGDDIEWACRSDCIGFAKDRLIKAYKNGEI